jgi:outer membrane receptor protein involved in Fe transport
MSSILALLLLGRVAEVRGQERVTVSGTVHDAESGEALPYASVMVQGTTLGTATNVDGHFALVGVPEGTHTLRVTYIGYAPASVGIDTDSLSGPLNIELSSAATSLGEVLVTAEPYHIMKTAETASQITVSPRDLAMLPTVGEIDIFRSLQLLPGISGTNESSSGLYVRGGTPDQNLVLLDGMTVYHVDHFFGFFSAFNADAIKDVQVFKGAYPAEYGGRTSSVVNLTGKTGADDYRMGVGVNLLSASTVAEVPLGDRGSFLVSARRSYTDVLQTGVYNSIYETVTGEDITSDDQGDGGIGPGGGALGGSFQGPGQATVQPDFHFYDLNAKLTYRPSDVDVLALSVYNGKDNLDQSRTQSTTATQGGFAGATTTSDVYDVTGWGNLGVSGKWSRQWTPRFYSNALVAYSQYFSDSERNTDTERLDAETDSVTFSRSTSRLEDNQLDDVSFRLDNQWQASSSHAVQFGLDATRRNARYTFNRDDTLSILDREQEALQAAAYVQDTWTPLPQLRLTAGVRTGYYDGTGDTYVEPRVSLNYDLTDRLQFKGAYGQYSQFVSRVVNESITEGARDFWLLADGDQVGVQKATHYVLGASYETPTWLLDMEAYRKDVAGLSEFSLRFRRSGAGVQASDLFFAGDGRTRGLEFLLQKKAGWYTGWLGYTLSTVEHTFDDLNGGEPFPALHDQTHEINVVNSFRLSPRWNVSATWVFGAGTPYTSPESEYTITLLDGSQQSYIHVGEKNGERLPAYHRLDAAINYRFPIGTSEVNVGLSVFNLYNHTNVWYKEFDLTQSPFVTTDVAYLGFTPNISLRVDL